MQEAPEHTHVWLSVLKGQVCIVASSFCVRLWRGQEWEKPSCPNTFSELGHEERFAEEFSWLLFSVHNNQPPYISHLFSDCNCILYGKFTKAACRLPDVPRKLTVLEMCALVSPTLMSSCLWEQALVLWVLDESCCSEHSVALATKPVKTPHFGPYRVLSGSHHTRTLRDVCLSLTSNERTVLEWLLIVANDWCLSHWCWQASLVKPPFCQSSTFPLTEVRRHLKDSCRCTVTAGEKAERI